MDENGGAVLVALHVGCRWTILLNVSEPCTNDPNYVAALPNITNVASDQVQISTGSKLYSSPGKRSPFWQMLSSLAS